MPPRDRRVASLYKRAVYKTEFDIFKRNTDIDLISLVSLEDDPNEAEFLRRRCVSGRPNTRKPDYSDYTRNKPYDRCISARIQSSRAQNYQSTKRVNGRTCKSAAPCVHRKANCAVQTKGRSQTSSGFRRSETGDLSTLNKRDKINVDFKCGRYISKARVTQSKPPPSVTRQVKSAYAIRTHCANRYVDNSESDSRSNRQACTTATKPVPVSRRAKSAVVSKVKAELRKDCLHEKASEEKDDVVSSDATQASAQCDDNEGHISEARGLPEFEKVVDESDDSGVVNDLSVTFIVAPQAWEDSSNKETADRKTLNTDINRCIDNVSVRSANACSDEDGVDNVPVEQTENDNIFDFNGLVKDLVTRKEAERNDYDPKYTKLDNSSVLSLEETVEETAAVNGTEESTASKSEHDLKDINMSRESKRVIIETLYDLRSKRNISDKENIDHNVRFKSVNKQKRIKENRNKYDLFMKERTETLLSLNIRTREDKNNRAREDSNKHDYKDAEDEYDSDFEDTSDLAEYEPQAQPQKQQKFFPSLTGSGKDSGKVSSHTGSISGSKHITTLEQMKKRKYKIPGIGNYELIASPDNDFEITPPGFDCRYNSRSILTKEELDPPPQCIQDRSIQKCKKWLKKVNLSPMTLNPVLNKR